jgi:hypothetical protein
MKRKLTLVLLTFVAWQMLAAEASACTCVDYDPPVCAQYWGADAVFAGVVTDIRKIPKDPPDSLPKALLRFTVEDAFRGLNTREVDVATLSGTSCDMTFKKGERWLVYAYLDAATGRLEIHPCTRTHQLQGGMNEDLDYIRAVRRGPPEQSVLGRLAYFRYDPLMGVKVSVRGGGQTFETETDADGRFNLRLPRGGAYTVSAVVPFSAVAGSRNVAVKTDSTDERTVIEYAVELPAGRCAYDLIDVYKVDLHATAEVSGKVLDESDRPVTRGQVRLFKAEPKEGADPEEAYTRIGADGSFKFEGVAVGNYYLVINPREEAPDEYDAPYPRTFYPGVAEQSKATPIVVTEGLKLEDLVFRVRPALRERVLKGVVVWPDGKPAAEANVSLYDAAQNRYVRMVRADAGGKFEMRVYGDFKYEVSAGVYGKKIGESEKVKVPDSDERPRLKLVVKPK